MLLVLLFVLPPCANAHFYRKGMIVRMAVAKCSGVDHGGFMNALAGSSNADVGMCRVYTMKTDRVVYRLQTRKDLLLPLGEDIEFRMSHKELLVKQDDSVDEARFTVISMKLVGEADEEDQRAIRTFANHCMNSHGVVMDCGEKESGD